MLLDLRYALRSMRRNPGYAAAAIVCLGLAMGVNATLFSFLNSMYFRGLPVPESNRIVQIHRQRGQVCGFRDFLAFRDRLTSLHVAAWLTAGIYADTGGVHTQLVFESVSANYAAVLRLRAFRGRWFLPDEDSPSAPPVVVLTHRFWQTRLQSDPAAIGRILRIQEQPFRIVGIAPPGFEGALPPWAVDAWIPKASLAAAFGLQGSDSTVNLIGRLNPGVNIERAAAELRGLDLPGHPGDPLRVESATGFAPSGRKYLKPVLTLMVAVCAMVLLIACVNVASLLLSRATVRRREMAIRQSLGAGRARLFRATLVEGLVLAAFAVALGLLTGACAGRLLALALPSVPISYYNGIRLAFDGRVALFLSASGVLCALLFSLPPAFANIRLSVKARHRDIYSLVQVALSLTLLIATGLLLRALHRAETADPGFAADRRLVMNLLAPPNKFSPDQAAQMYNRLLAQARALPGVKDATLEFYSAECAAPSVLAAPRRLAAGSIDPNYFDVLHIPVVRGTTAGPLVINETAARAFWPGQDPLGKTLWLGCRPPNRRIAQVAGVVRDGSDPFLYFSRAQSVATVPARLILWTAGDPHRWSRPLLQIARGGSPDLFVFEVQSLRDESAGQFWELKWQTALLAAVGLLAALLAAIGLYGVLAYSVARRTREIGIRVALGAAPADVRRLIVAHGLRIGAGGIACGLLLSAAAVRFLRSYLYGMSPFDPAAFAAASVAWLLIAALASWLPARRATRIDPAAALKTE